MNQSQLTRQLIVTIFVFCSCTSIEAVSIQIINEAPPTLGQNYTLNCNVSGTNYNATTYHWIKDDNITLNETKSTLLFESLSLLDSGMYTCIVTVNETSYNYSMAITLQLPPPNSVTVTSDPVSPIQPFVYPTVILTCTVELSPAVSVPVIVTIVWTGPDEFVMNKTVQPVTGSTNTYISTAVVSSFGRNQSGNYTCTGTVSSTSPFLTDSSNQSDIERITTGVYVSYNGSVLINDSNIAINIIETSDTVNIIVKCTSDRMPCCQDEPQYGEWYFPNGSHVIHKSEGAVAFHRKRDDFGNVLLLRINANVMSPSGKFCCEIEDATHTNQTLCVNICNSVCVQITDGVATPTLGQSYSLTCSVARAQINTYQWSKDGVRLNENGSVLSFQNLSLSDSGLYTCAIIIPKNGSEYNSSVVVDLKYPISVNIFSNPVSPIWPVGSNVTLNCTVELDPAVNVPVTVNTEWTLPNGLKTTNIAQPVIGKNTTYTSMIIFRSFGRDESGNYTCTADVSSTSPFLTSSTSSHTEEIISGYVRISDGGASPILGENYTLTCGVAGVFVNITSFEWTKNDIMLSQNQSLSFYNILVSDAGLYTCEIIVDMMPYTSSKNNVLKVPAPASVTLTSDPTTPIRPVGSDVTLTCTIELTFPENFTVTVNIEWTGPTGLMTTNTAQPVNGSTTTYTSTAMVSSFGRKQSEEYICSVNVSSMDMLLITSDSKSGTIRVTVGVYLSHNGDVIDPNSYIIITDIGTALQGHKLVCITDRNPCCKRPDTAGEWIFPNGTNVTILGAGPTQFYRNRGFNGEVNLYRVSDDVITPTGKFCCNVPDAINNIHNVCVNVVSLQISGSEETVTVGQNVSRTCRVLGVDNQTLVNYQWEKDNEEVLSMDGVLSFSTISLSDSGVYTCVARIGNTTYIDNKTIIIQTPTPTTVTMMTDPNQSDIGEIAGLIGTLSLLFLIFCVIVLVIFVLLSYRKRKTKTNMKEFEYSSDKPIDLPSHQKSEPEAIELRHTVEHNENSEEQDHPGHHGHSVPLSEFVDYVNKMHTDKNALFEREFNSLRSVPKSSHNASKYLFNKEKNRFTNIFPYDKNRVKLNEIPEVEGSDYINASFLDGYEKQAAYIAAQGPLPNTLEDFWRMIWEQKLPTIVMLTKCFEDRKKCECYWPDRKGEPFSGGYDIIIKLTMSVPFSDFVIRKMTVERESEPDTPPLKVTQLHFTAWPDHGVPNNTSVMLNIIRRVRKLHPYTDPLPLLVHCSAGVGRTGTFIVLDSMLERMKTEESFDILEFVKTLRAGRVSMIQTLAQYMFIYDTLRELIMCGETEILASNLKVLIDDLHKIKDESTGFEHQFQTLESLLPKLESDSFKIATEEYNVDKNRYPDKIPCDGISRIVLRWNGEVGSDYINASYINGYKQRRAYIATQGPLESTVNDFWRMVWEQKSCCVVMLCQLEENDEEMSVCYWPSDDNITQAYGEVIVKKLTQVCYEDLVWRTFEVDEKKEQSTSESPSDVKTAFTVTQFQLLVWPEYETPPITSSLIELVDNVNKVQMKSGNRPVIIMCNDGMGRTGTFICIHAQLERLKTEGIVDFFQFVKSARTQRPGVILNVSQYELCHSTVLQYLQSCEDYANFKDVM